MHHAGSRIKLHEVVEELSRLSLIKMSWRLHHQLYYCTGDFTIPYRTVQLQYRATLLTRTCYTMSVRLKVRLVVTAHDIAM